MILAVDYTGQYWVAVAGTQIYRSTNYAQTFTLINTVTGANFQAVTSDYTGQYLVAADINNGNVMVSNDYGSTWATSYTISNMYRLDADATGTLINVACYNGYLYQSADRGDTFYQISSTYNQWTAISMPAQGKYLKFKALCLSLLLYRRNLSFGGGK